MNSTKTGGLHECSRMISSSCSTCGNRRVIFVRKNNGRVISLARGKKDGNLNTTNEIYSWSFVTQIFRNGSLNHDGDRKTFWSDDFNILVRKHWFNNSRPLSRKSWCKPETLEYLREIYFIYWLNFDIPRLFKFTVYIIVRFTCFDFITKANTQHINNTICI